MFLNGLARGCVPAGPPDVLLARPRHRAQGRRRGARGGRADGLPARLRRLVRRGHGDRDRSGPRRPSARIPREVAAELYGGVAATLDALREGAAGGPDRTAGTPSCARWRTSAAPASRDELTDDRAPLHPLRLYRELRAGARPRTPIVIGDGGDFVSFAGRVIDTYEPGCWMDPGPYGCLGAGPGLRARREDRPPGPRRSACCSATARSASRGWSSTRWCATACPWSA